MLGCLQPEPEQQGWGSKFVEQVLVRLRPNLHIYRLFSKCIFFHISKYPHPYNANKDAHCLSPPCGVEINKMLGTRKEHGDVEDRKQFMMSQKIKSDSCV